MEEIMHLVVSGFRLAKALESDMQGQLIGAGDMADKCEEISRSFTAACDRLRALHRQVVEDQAAHAAFHHWREEEGMTIAPDEAAAAAGTGVGPTSAKGKEVIVQLPSGSGGSGGGDEGGGEFRLPAYVVKSGDGASGRGCEGSPSQKSRKRKDETGKRTVEVPAPQHGNTEIPPDDGFTWRKYGQKEILGAKFPRGYYRCTHQKLYGCPAKKQVQRLDNKPHIFEVTYRGEHICHMSSTAPAIPPPPTTAATTSATTHQYENTSLSLPSWIHAAGFTSQPTLTAAGSTSVAPPTVFDVYGRHPNVLRIGNSGGGTGSASASNVMGGRDQGEYHATVVDMAAAMFNAGGSGGDCMDSIFSERPDQPGEGKN